MSADARGVWSMALAVAMVSAAALAYQWLLMRWLAIAHWSPFAVTIISLALLGHGASGTALCLWLARRRAAGATVRFERAFALCALLFALTSLLAVALARRLPFNGLELVWDPRQAVWLGALYVTLSIPFFFAACCFGLAFVGHGARIPLLYGADLGGAGLGALAALALAFVAPAPALLAVAASGALAACVVPMHARARWWCVAAALGVFALGVWMQPRLAPPPNPFKAQARTLLLPQAQVIAQRDSPYGQTAVVASPQVPLRHAPGLSLGHVQALPPQLGVFVDGEAASVLVRGGRSGGWLSAMTSALPYRVCAPRRVLVLGAGGGVEVLQALALGARHVDAVELDPRRMQLIRDGLSRYSGGLFQDRRVHVHAADARAFVRAASQRYDLIVLAGVDAFTSSAAGAQSTAEQYGATVEAMADYLARLSPRGCIAITRWSRPPPREELRFLSTAAAALRGRGHPAVSSRVIAIRNWDASTWIVAPGAFTPAQIAETADFAEQHGFDVVHLPGTRKRAAKFHYLDPPTLYDGVDALLSPRADAWMSSYPFAVGPVRDDRPYAGHYFRWRGLPDAWKLRGQGSAVWLDSGHLLLVAALVQAVLLSLLLVLWPLRALPRPPSRAGGFPRLRAGLYFLALGLAFLFVEIATLSRLTLLVGHPLPAVGLGLAAFLLFAGAGSVHAHAWLQRNPLAGEAALSRRIRQVVGGIALGLVWQLAVFAAVRALAPGWPVPWRALCALVGIAPLAFAMGQPFALGLARLARRSPDFVPWAWGLNGCASVLSALVASLLALTVGLLATLWCALALYVFAAWVWRADGARGGSTLSAT